MQEIKGHATDVFNLLLWKKIYCLLGNKNKRRKLSLDKIFAMRETWGRHFEGDFFVIIANIFIPDPAKRYCEIFLTFSFPPKKQVEQVKEIKDSRITVHYSLPPT